MSMTIGIDIKEWMTDNTTMNNFGLLNCQENRHAKRQSYLHVCVGLLNLNIHSIYCTHLYVLLL